MLSSALVAGQHGIINTSIGLEVPQGNFPFINPCQLMSFPFIN